MSNVIVSIEPSKKEGEYTVALTNNQKKQYAISKYRPKEDVINKLDLEGVGKETAFIVFGYCFGYGVEQIIRTVGEYAKVLVVEPNQESLNEQLRLSQVAIEVAIEDVYLTQSVTVEYVSSENYEQIAQWMKGLVPGTKIKLISNSIYEQYYLEEMKYILQQVVEVDKKRTVSFNTTNRFSKIWFDNIVKNKEVLAKSYDFSAYKNLYKDVPALIVSAGPSLEKNIEYIKNFQGIILVGARTLKDVMDQGVKPDFMVGLDAQDILYNLLKEHKDNEIPIIAPMQANPKFVGSTKGPVFFVKIGSAIEDTLYDIQLPSGTTGPSVANFTLDRAYEMGCDPIIFIGQDLAYTDNKHHAGDQHSNGGKHKVTNFNVELDGYWGGKVPSAIDLKMFLDWIEQFIALNPNRNYINCTEGGARIKGTSQQSFESYVKQNQVDYNLQKPLVKLIKEDSKTIDERVQEKVQLMEQAIEYAQQGKKLCKQLKKEYTLYQAKRTPQVNRILKKLDDVVDKNVKEVKPIIRQLLSDKMILIEKNQKYKGELNETLVQQGIRVADKNYEIYTAIEVSLKEALEIIRENR